MLSLYVQAKNIKNNILHIKGTKTEKADRYVPIPEILLKKIPALKKDEYLCPSIGGVAPTNRHHREYMWKSFKKEMEKYMELEDDLVPYCLRHTYCTDLQDAGVPINVAREFMGHSSINLTSKIYTHLTEESFENARVLINGRNTILPR